MCRNRRPQAGPPPNGSRRAPAPPNALDPWPEPSPLRSLAGVRLSERTECGIDGLRLVDIAPSAVVRPKLRRQLREAAVEDLQHVGAVAIRPSHVGKALYLLHPVVKGRRNQICTPISNRARIAGCKSPASIPARQRGGRSVGPTCAANACGRRPRRRPATAAAACAGHGGHAGAGRRARSLVRIRLTIAPPSVTATPLDPSPGLSRRRHRADPSDNRRSSTAASVANASRCRQRDGKWPPCRPRRLTRGPPSTSTRPSLHSGGSDASIANPERAVAVSRLERMC